MNAVEYGITNALTEGLNSKIETIKRAACGFSLIINELYASILIFFCHHTVYSFDIGFSMIWQKQIQIIP